MYTFIPLLEHHHKRGIVSLARKSASCAMFVCMCMLTLLPYVHTHTSRTVEGRQQTFIATSFDVLLSRAAVKRKKKGQKSCVLYTLRLIGMFCSLFLIIAVVRMYVLVRVLYMCVLYVCVYIWILSLICPTSFMCFWHAFVLFCTYIAHGA